ncbi:hypothetical protein IWW36_000841 [Coemansia brasiliensis]|uniref:PABS domain-containing protein n=1 Tax=Coemansia brasiliensis TaxID=2650707 RepID=A0A9W8IAH1_9FUNG|nr:hypothetical protein IWW36_000841 [Coemansia brasiliensis]
MDTANKSPSNPLTMDTRVGHALSTGLDIAALLTALTPLHATYLFRWSSNLGPMWGPLLTHCVLSYPVFLLSAFVVFVAVGRISHDLYLQKRQFVVALGSFGVIGVAVWLGQQYGSTHRSCQGMLINAGYSGLSALVIKLLVGHQENLDVAAALKAHQKELKDGNEEASQHVQTHKKQPHTLRFIPTIACIILVITTMYTDRACNTGVVPYNSNTSDLANYKMLFRKESTTGWVTVADQRDRGIRFMRSGHSLIGGHWLRTSESIFGIFYYADAVRMIKHRKSNPVSKQKRMHDLQPQGWSQKLSRKAFIGDGTERALIIGLGVGVTARSLYEQNVKVDIVEIDQAVYDAAVKYFNLPKKLNSVNIMDGRRFIDEAHTGTYDYVVHDVFTGGSVPASLFSQSAVMQLKRILKSDGVLAMNFVGVPNDKRTLSHVARTIGTTFPFMRCFAEITEDLDAMVNMMFFASAKHVLFDITSDVLRAMGSNTIRSRTLARMLDNEINISEFIHNSTIQPITDDWNPLSKWQVDTAVQHWQVMRELLPNAYWLNY